MEWLDKDRERIRIDLANGTADFLPEGVTLESAVHKAGGWELAFACEERAGNRVHQLFNHTYYGEDGNSFAYNISSTSYSLYNTDAPIESAERPGVFFTQFALAGYHEDVVYLSPTYSRTVILNAPVVIEVK